LIDLFDREILQINSTIIAGGLIFLTFINFGDRTGTSDEIGTNMLRSVVALAIVTWFSISCIACIAGKHHYAMKQMYYGFSVIAILAILLLVYTYYDYYSNLYEKSISIKSNQSQLLNATN
jgi:hypothetical protein